MRRIKVYRDVNQSNGMERDESFSLETKGLFTWKQGAPANWATG